MRRRDDHLCFVAGISRLQIKELRRIDVTTLEGLGDLQDVPRPTRGSRDALARTRDQAAIQLLARRSGAPQHEVLEPLGPEHGLALLPAPSTHDIFLDLEGDRLAPSGGREYLFGLLVADDAAQPRGRAVATRVSRALGRDPRRREARVRARRRFDSRDVPRASRHARLSLRRLRAFDVQAIVGTVRDARGRDRYDLARRAFPRSLHDRAALAQSERRKLFDQGSRAVLRTRAQAGPARGDREPARRRVGHRDARGLGRYRRSSADGRPAGAVRRGCAAAESVGRARRRRRALQPRGLRIRRKAARLARAAARGGRGQSRHRAAAARAQDRRSERARRGHGRGNAARDARTARRCAGGRGRAQRRAARALAHGALARMASARGQGRVVGVLPPARLGRRGLRGGALGARGARVRAHRGRHCPRAGESLFVFAPGPRPAQEGRSVRAARGRLDRRDRRNRRGRAHDRHPAERQPRERAAGANLRETPRATGHEARRAARDRPLDRRERRRRPGRAPRRARPLAAPAAAFHRRIEGARAERRGARRARANRARTARTTNA